ncbi:hypothetical protein QF001_001617 [Paraburkholderia youngii]|uniref:hypothetical protein n=1 Tax=Paraburkholderia youngii TaxID=2782701 RepID=UPI003D1A7ED5
MKRTLNKTMGLGRNASPAAPVYDRFEGREQGGRDAVVVDVRNWHDNTWLQLESRIMRRIEKEAPSNKPIFVIFDHGPEFVSRRLVAELARREVSILYRPPKYAY